VPVVTEQSLGELRWIVLRGPDREAFRALGAHMREEIREVVGGWTGLDPVRDHVARPPGNQWLAAVRQASEERHRAIWAELSALAEGAGVPLDDLALLNFRGDVGIIEPVAGGGTGCSDLAWRRQRSFIGHNEDDSVFFATRCAMLTLALDDLPVVTAFWKPGFLPSNTVSVTGTGLVWSIDHLPTSAPGAGAGRHIVARGLQRTAGTVGQAIEYLREHPSAGGFAYVIGDRAGRVVIVEASAGQHAWRAIGPDGPLAWHTNHGRYLAGADADLAGSSQTRGHVLNTLGVPAGEPDTAWFLQVLAGATPPAGVRAEPCENSQTATLCTFVADLTGGDMTVLSRSAPAVTIGLANLAHGLAAARI
jgi:hypothetical protein